MIEPENNGPASRPNPTDDRPPMNAILIRLYVNLRTALNRMRFKWHPPRTMPPEMVAKYTQDGTIPVLDWYIHEGKPRSLVWTPRSIGWNPDRARRRKRMYYGNTDTHVHAALDTCPMEKAHAVILGSETPWYECICVTRGARVTTVEYRDVDCSIPGLRVLKPSELDALEERFDVALSISSLEHAGLGRYGDPLDPDADLMAMRDLARLLKPGGRLLVAVPVGADAVVWNAHRIYGRKRLPRLLDGWRVLGSFGYEESMLDAPLGRWDRQPVWVLTPERP